MSIHLLPRPILVAAFALIFFLSGCALLGGGSAPEAADPSLTGTATTTTPESAATESADAAIATFTPAATAPPAAIATAAVITLESAVETAAPPVTAITDTITAILTDSITATLTLLATPTPATDQASGVLSLLPTVTPTTAIVPIDGGALLTATEPSAPDASTTDVITSAEGISDTAPLTAPVAPPAALPPGTFTVTSPANLRGGPSTDYPIAGAGNVGQTFTAQGRNETSDWLQICCVNEQPVWIFAPLGTLVGPLESLAVVAAPPLPTTPITNTVAPDAALPVTTTDSAPPAAATEAAP